MTEPPFTRQLFVRRYEILPINLEMEL